MTDKTIHNTVGCYINNPETGLYLLVKSPKWGDHWVVPGGHIEEGETIEQAAVRETKEEVGLETRAARVIDSGVLENPPEFYKPLTFHFSNVLLETSLDDQSLVLDQREIIEAKWINLDEISHLAQAGYVQRAFDKIRKSNYA